MGAEASSALGAQCCCSTRAPPLRRGLQEKQRPRAADGEGLEQAPEVREPLASPRARDADGPVEVKRTTPRTSQLSLAAVAGDASASAAARAQGSAPDDLTKASDATAVTTARSTLAPSLARQKTELPSQVAAQRVKEIERAQGLVRGPARKKAVSNKLFGGAKDRYIAAMPGPQDKLEGDDVATWKRWRRGALGYWENRDAFERRLQPKGFVQLLHITQITQLNPGTRQTGVVVLYEDPKTQIPDRLELSFDSPARADEWKEAMRCLRAALNKAA